MTAMQIRWFGCTVIAVSVLAIGCHGTAARSRTDGGDSSIASTGGTLAADAPVGGGGGVDGSSVGGHAMGGAPTGGTTSGQGGLDAGGPAGGTSQTGDSGAGGVVGGQGGLVGGNDDGALGGQGGLREGDDGSTGGSTGRSGDADGGSPGCVTLDPLNLDIGGCFTGECVALTSDGACPAGTRADSHCPSGVGKPCAVLYSGQIPCCVPIPPGCDITRLNCDCFPLNVCGLAGMSGGIETGAVCVSVTFGSDGGSITCEQHGPA